MDKLDQLISTLQMATNERRFNKLNFYEPYPKQLEFHNSKCRERLLRAGNQVGKTYAGAAETAIHLTGRYPDYWSGHAFNHEVVAWCSGEGATLTRDGPQKLLCGAPGVEGSLGTGLIPKECFLDKPSLSRGVTDAFDTIQVRHGGGGDVQMGTSILSFKSYDQGRAKHQAATLDFFWDDEEPPEDIYTEHLARISSKNDGFGFITFTPLKGMSTVVAKFLQEYSPDRADIVMTLWDVPGMTQEKVDKIMASYPAWQRDARINGVPMQGAGRVFAYADDQLEEDPIPLSQVPEHWRKLWGIDFGINHPFGAVLGAHDLDADVIHILAAVKMKDGLPLNHVAAMRPIAANIPVAWPQDGTQRRDDGKPLANQYKSYGLRMLQQHATWPDGSISTEAAINEISQRIETNRFKVSRALMRSAFGDEFRNYHRDEKTLQIVKVGDDLMSATQKFIMHKRAAVQGPIQGDSNFGPARREETRPFADGVDFDVF